MTRIESTFDFFYQPYPKQAIRNAKDWRAQAALRGQIASLGWGVSDTPEGQRVKRVTPTQPEDETSQA